MARLGELLVAAGLLTTEQVERALRAQVMWGARLGTNLIELGFIDLDTLSTVLAQQHTLPAALARHFEKVDRELQRSLHADIAEMYTVLPLVRVRDRDIVLASSSPLTKKAQARIADELAVEPEQIISAIAAELRMRYQLERVYNIQRPARFMRSPGKTIPPFPAFVEQPESLDDDLVELELEAPQSDVRSTEPFLATYTAPTGRTPSIPPATLEHKKPVPTVDEMHGVDVDMDDSSSRVPAKPEVAAPPRPIGNLPFTQPSMPIPGVEPVVIKPRTAEARTGVTQPAPAPPPAPVPSAPPTSTSSGRIEIITPSSEHEIATVPVSKLDEREVTLDSEAPIRPSSPGAKPEPSKPGFVKPVPSAKPPKPPTKFPSVAKFDAIAEADGEEIETAIPEVVADAQTRPAGKPVVIEPKVEAPKRDDETKPGLAVAKSKPAPIAKGGAIPSIVKPKETRTADEAIETARKAEEARIRAEEARARTEAAADAARAKADAIRAQGIVPKKNQTTPGVLVPRPPAARSAANLASTTTPAPGANRDAKSDTPPDATTSSDARRAAKPEAAPDAKPETVEDAHEISDAVSMLSDTPPLFADGDPGAPDGGRDAVPRERRRRASTESGAIAIPHRTIGDLDTLSAEVDDALSIPEAVEDDRSSGRERRRYVRTIADVPTDSERQSQSLGRIAIRRLAVARAESEADGNTLGEATRAIRRATNRERVADLCVDTLFRFAPSCAAASLLVVRGQVATTWKGFIRDGSTPPEIAVPLDQPGLIPKAVHRNATVRAVSTDLGPIDQLLMVSLAQKTGDIVIVPISIARQVMCVIAIVTDSDAPIATAESVAAGAGAAFARLMRDASR